MTLAEKIWGSSIGAFIAYGKTAAAAALKPLLVTDNGDGTGTLVVSASSSALPTGAATSANQTDIIKAEDAVHSSGDKGIMALGIRKDTVANTAGTDGDYEPLPIGANGLYVDAHLGEVLSYLLDSIDVAKMSAGAVTTHHNAITAAVTLANTVEVDCRGFNSMRVHLNIDTTDKSCVFDAYGAMGSGLTFVPHLDSAGAAIVYTTSISGWYIITGICDYMKIVPSTVTSGATVTCKVQPFNQ